VHLVTTEVPLQQTRDDTAEAERDREGVAVVSPLTSVVVCMGEAIRCKEESVRRLETSCIEVMREEGNGEKWRRTGDDVDVAARGHGEEEGRTEERRKGKEQESETGKGRQARRDDGRVERVYVRAQIEDFKILPGNALVQKEAGERKE
jgi:hypothetical protein